jgi:hypothetical protein
MPRHQRMIAGCNELLGFQFERAAKGVCTRSPVSNQIYEPNLWPPSPRGRSLDNMRAQDKTS